MEEENNQDQHAHRRKTKRKGSRKLNNRNDEKGKKNNTAMSTSYVETSNRQMGRKGKDTAKREWEEK